MSFLPWHWGTSLFHFPLEEQIISLDPTSLYFALHSKFTTWPKEYSWPSSNAPVIIILPFSGACTGRHFATEKEDKTKHHKRKGKSSHFWGLFCKINCHTKKLKVQKTHCNFLTHFKSIDSFYIFAYHLQQTQWPH